jgi:hypothetical protein
MLPNNKLSEAVAQLANIAPISQGVGTAVSGWVSVKNVHEIMALISVGVFGASATVDAKIQQATSSGGAGAKDITGKAIVQMLAAGGNGKIGLINLRTQELDTNNGFNFVQLSVTVGTAATLISAELMAAPTRYMPASDLNQAAVTQVIA